jgi:class 3 adenylate cyclase
LGNGFKALEYHEALKRIDDSLAIEETAKSLQQMEFQNEMLKDSIEQAEESRAIELEHERELQNREQMVKYTVASGSVLLLIAIGLFTRVRYIRRAKSILQTEKDRSEHLLLNILPYEIAEELKAKGEAEARTFDNVTILFSDFKDFTQASEKLSATDLVAEINTCFKAFDQIMDNYSIEKIKTIGDAYMAVGGLPVPSADSAKNTVLAALEMQSLIIERKAQNEAVNKPAFEMRAGIHTGSVVAGIVGAKKFQYDIWGDTVNTASRMETSGEVGQVNISEVTYELIKNHSEFTFTSRGKVEVKGKGEVAMWFVTNNKQPDE